MPKNSGSPEANTTVLRPRVNNLAIERSLPGMSPSITIRRPANSGKKARWRHDRRPGLRPERWPRPMRPTAPRGRLVRSRSPPAAHAPRSPSASANWIKAFTAAAASGLLAFASRARQSPARSVPEPPACSRPPKRSRPARPRPAAAGRRRFQRTARRVAIKGGRRVADDEHRLGELAASSFHRA